MALGEIALVPCVSSPTEDLRDALEEKWRDALALLVQSSLSWDAVCCSVLAVCCSVLQGGAVRRSVVQCAVVCCCALQCVLQWRSGVMCWRFFCKAPCRGTRCVAVCCSVLQCVAVCCSTLQCAAVCCCALQCVLQWRSGMMRWRFLCRAPCCSMLQCVAVRCSVVQCVAVRVAVAMWGGALELLVQSFLSGDAVCCSVLQRVAVCCSVLQCVAVHVAVDTRCGE